MCGNTGDMMCVCVVIQVTYVQQCGNTGDMMCVCVVIQVTYVQQCGNGVIERGEECDCQTVEVCF